MRRLVAIRQLVETTGEHSGMRHILSVTEVPSIMEAVRREEMKYGVGHGWEVTAEWIARGLKVAVINAMSSRGDFYKTEVWSV